MIRIGRKLPSRGYGRTQSQHHLCRRVTKTSLSVHLQSRTSICQASHRPGRQVPCLLWAQARLPALRILGSLSYLLHLLPRTEGGRRMRKTFQSNLILVVMLALSHYKEASIEDRTRQLRFFLEQGSWVAHHQLCHLGFHRLVRH